MKTNKNSLHGYAMALIAGALCLCWQLSAQKVVGIYLTDKDFKDGKLFYQNNCAIKVKSAWPKKRIKINYGKEIVYLSKDTIYGYKDKDGNSYRFFNGFSCQLINSGEEIQLYKLQVSNANKYEPAIFSYFFSRNLSTPVLPLTINNLLSAFSDNERFIEWIELRYRYDSELMEYDTYHKKYKLNYFLQRSRM